MSLPALFRELKAAGVTEKQLQSVLNELEIEPVLTAHPTEAKRRAVLNQMSRLTQQWESSRRSFGGALADRGNPRAKNRPAARGGHGAVLFQPHDF
jgi:phosphoenolpyruvate carboxylase